MEPGKQLVDAIFWDKVRRAQGMTGEERVAEGLRIYERAVSVMRDGIRHQFPGADYAEVERILRERLDLIRRLEGGS